MCKHWKSAFGEATQYKQMISKKKNYLLVTLTLENHTQGAHHRESGNAGDSEVGEQFSFGQLQFGVAQTGAASLDTP